jgi:hypothetical protein
MPDRYPHAPECRPHQDDCASTCQQAAFEAGRKEGLEEADTIVRLHPSDARIPSDLRHELAERIRALKDTNG